MEADGLLLARRRRPCRRRRGALDLLASGDGSRPSCASVPVHRRRAHARFLPTRAAGWRLPGNDSPASDRLSRRARPPAGRGCGSGQLLIRFAKSAPGEYVGLDSWKDDWEYSKAQCERNAELEGVRGLRFVHGSASRLPFPSRAFGRVISCLTFHEMRDVPDKTASLAEALRVLVPGGRYALL